MSPSNTSRDIEMSNGVTPSQSQEATATNADMETEEEATLDEPGDEEEILLGNLPKITILSGASTHAISFQIEKEDHTLGNSLRYFINKNPDVEFCGYTIPHPSETRMCVRIQTWEDTNTTAFEALRKGLEDMVEACEVIEDKFVQARDDFEKSSR